MIEKLARFQRSFKLYHRVDEFRLVGASPRRAAILA
jgi:hypothetical protein